MPVGKAYHRVEHPPVVLVLSHLEFEVELIQVAIQLYNKVVPCILRVVERELQVSCLCNSGREGVEVPGQRS